jgi:adenine-specific DNA-methyltransferase
VAHIDNLIDSIKDPQLRAALRAEYDKVTKNRRLGLVFDRHLPESVVLPGFAIREGEKVQFLADGMDDPAELDGSGVWTVTKVGSDVTLLRDGNGDGREAPTGRLVATREFGDPIYPGLISTGRVIRGGGTDGDDGGKPFHTVINAENYHALEALLFAHEAKIDAIYIDPPYNSGARDWKYNNDYVDKNDGYRHSKWLSFMERRLLLAKKLLNPENSVLIVAIDENEVNRLGLLLQQVFPASKVQMVTVLINPAGASIIDQFSRVDEHLFFVHIGAARPLRTRTDTTPGASTFVSEDGVAKAFTWEPFQRSGGNSRRQDTKAKFFPVYIHEETQTIVGCGNHLPEGIDRSQAPASLAGCVAQWPIKSDGSEACWQLSAPTFRQYLEEGRIKIGRRNARTGRYGLSFLTKGHMKAIADGDLVVDGRDEKGSLIVKTANGKVRPQVGKTMWTNGAHSATEHGSTLLRAFLPRRKFPFPKSLYAVEDALRYYIGDKPDALVLDFFAGSGTTAHAVMRLNRQDGGRRRSISVTNNEVSAEEAEVLRRRGLTPGDPGWEALGIYEYITKPRISAAISGRTPQGDPIEGEYRFVDEFPRADGLDENAEFFTLTYEDPALVTLGRRFEAIAPLLWLRAGAVGERIDRVAEGGWAIPSDAFYGVLFDTSAWGAFVAEAARRDDLMHAFIVTDSLVEYQQVVARLDPALKTTRLYADYLRSFEINTRA